MGDLGIVGLGLMGGNIAHRLLAAGHHVIGYNRTAARAAWLLEADLQLVTSPRRVAEAADVVFSSMSDSAALRAVADGPDGIVAGLRPGSVWVELSTVSPVLIRQLAGQVEAAGGTMLDAPVSGGEKGAIDAALSIMVGGEKADFDAALPIFQALGKTITHLGPLGAGGFTKLANQIIVAVNLTALGEALTLARKAGLDRALTLKALGGGLAASKCLEQKTPNYVAGTYNPGFKIDLHFKDLGLIMESSRALGVPLPCTAVVQELFNALRVKGKGGLDHSGVITLLEELAGMPNPS